jgi:hypothetical protein
MTNFQFPIRYLSIIRYPLTDDLSDIGYGLIPDLTRHVPTARSEENPEFSAKNHDGCCVVVSSYDAAAR